METHLLHFSRLFSFFVDAISQQMMLPILSRWKRNKDDDCWLAAFIGDAQHLEKPGRQSQVEGNSCNVLRVCQKKSANIAAAG